MIFSRQPHFIIKLLVSFLLLLQVSTAYTAELLSDLGGDSGFGQIAMDRNDDGYSIQIDITSAFPEGLNYFGNIYGLVYINNNGNITFKDAVSQFTPDPFPIADQPMIAPFWGDVDTRGGDVNGENEYSNDVYYSFAKEGKFIVTWFNVGYFSEYIDKLNSFQMILTDRSDTGAGAFGNFDVEYRYNRLEWTTGDASGGTNGLGGTPAQMGFDAGDKTRYYSHPASQTEAILDLVNTSNIGIDGVWRFEVRDGVVTEPPVLTDVKLKLFLPLEGITIDDTTFSEAPDSIYEFDGERVVEWNYDAFTVTRTKDLSFDIVLNDPVAGEKRVVSHRMELSYKDVNNNLVIQKIGEKVVDVLSTTMTVSVTTNKEIYAANEVIKVDSVVKNLSDIDLTTNVRLSIYSEDGTFVEEVDIFPNELILATNEKPFTSSHFNTASKLIGKYKARAELVDADGNITTLAETSFSIKHDNNEPLASLRVTVDKPVYNTSDQVTIGSLSHNLAPNVLIKTAMVKLKVLNPDGTVNSELEQAVGDLPSDSIRQLNSLQTLSSAVEGDYRITAELLDKNSIVLATAQTEFAVVEARERTITGVVQVALQSIYAGVPQTCVNTIENNGSLDLDNAVFRQILVNIDEATNTIYSDHQVGKIIQGGQYQFSSNIDTNSLEQGQYSCILQRQDGIKWQTLAFQFFKVDMLAMTASLNATQYLNNMPVNIKLEVNNPTDVDFIGTVKLEVIDAESTVITELPLIPAVIGAGKIINLSGIWNTEDNIAGDYQVRASLIDSNNQSIELHNLPFEITAVLNTALDISLNKDKFLAEETVEISQMLINNSNTALVEAVLKTIVKNAQGEIVYTQNTTIPSLAIKSQQPVDLDFKLALGSELGIYSVESQLIKGTEQLAYAQTSFEVIQQQIELLLSLDKSNYQLGNQVQMLHRVNNKTPKVPLENAKLRVFVSSPSGAEIYTHERAINKLSAKSVKLAAKPNQGINLLMNIADDAELGTYHVKSQVINEKNEVLASAQANFAVQAIGVAPKAIPTISQWSILLLILSLMSIGYFGHATPRYKTSNKREKM